MATQQIQSKGIYHGLPVYPSDQKGLTAIITGANGISGYYMYRVLAQDTRLWKKIYCLSRRPPLIPGGLPDHVEHIPLDFLKDPKEIAAVLKERNVTADHVFFFSYIQPPPLPGKGLWSDAEETARVNSELLKNFLEALKTASITPKRFMLQTGVRRSPFQFHHQTKTLPGQELRRPSRSNQTPPRRNRPPRNLRTKFLLPTGGPPLVLLQGNLCRLEHLHAGTHPRRCPRCRDERRFPARSLRSRMQKTWPTSRFPGRHRVMASTAIHEQLDDERGDGAMGCSTRT